MFSRIYRTNSVGTGTRQRVMLPDALAWVKTHHARTVLVVDGCPEMREQSVATIYKLCEGLPLHPAAVVHCTVPNMWEVMPRLQGRSVLVIANEITKPMHLEWLQELFAKYPVSDAWAYFTGPAHGGPAFTVEYPPHPPKQNLDLLVTISGATGSGKTVTAEFITRKLRELGIEVAPGAHVNGVEQLLVRGSAHQLFGIKGPADAT